jgi:hypothetical protein
MATLWYWLMEPSSLPRLVTTPCTMYVAWHVAKAAALFIRRGV